MAQKLHPASNPRDDRLFNELFLRVESIDDNKEPLSNTGTLAILLSGLANRIKVITGKQTWLEAPDKSVAALAQELDNHLGDGGAHGATSALSVNAIVRRDANGRAQFADPSDAKDAATKGYVDAHINRVDAHINRTDNPHNVTAAQLGLGDVLTHLAQILDSRIVEMGSNSNGTYVRWENGLQVCFGGRRAAEAYLNTTYRLFWTYPAAFVDTPTAGATRSTDVTLKSARLTGPAIRSISNTGFSCDIYDPNGGFADGETWYVYPIAIGRWK